METNLKDLRTDLVELRYNQDHEERYIISMEHEIDDLNDDIREAEESCDNRLIAIEKLKDEIDKLEVKTSPNQIPLNFVKEVK